MSKIIDLINEVNMYFYKLKVGHGFKIWLDKHMSVEMSDMVFKYTWITPLSLIGLCSIYYLISVYPKKRDFREEMYNLGGGTVKLRRPKSTIQTNSEGKITETYTQEIYEQKVYPEFGFMKNKEEFYFKPHSMNGEFGPDKYERLIHILEVYYEKIFIFDRIENRRYIFTNITPEKLNVAI